MRGVSGVMGEGVRNEGTCEGVSGVAGEGVRSEWCEE